MARAASVALEKVRLRREVTQALADSTTAGGAKDAFLASISREIRTPLNGVATMAELLSRTQLDPRQQQLCAVLQSSTQDVVHLICEILDFARVEAGRANI